MQSAPGAEVKLVPLPEVLWPMETTTDYLEARDGARLRWLRSVKRESSRGTVIVLPGRAEFIEKYFEVAADLWERDFEFVILDFRGQGLSSRPLANRMKHHLEDVDLLVDDLDEFFDNLSRFALPEPFIVLAHSMGGHVALRFLAERRSTVEAAVLTAPLIDIRFAGIPRKLAVALVKIATATGHNNSYGLGQGDYGPVSRSRASMALLTSDPVRFGREHDLIARNPDLALGGVTYGWLRAMLKSCRHLQQVGYAERITIPVLAVQAGHERLVDNQAMTELMERLPHGELVKIEEARHEILQERDSIRALFWNAFDAFVAESVTGEYAQN